MCVDSAVTHLDIIGLFEEFLCYHGPLMRALLYPLSLEFSGTSIQVPLLYTLIIIYLSFRYTRTSCILLSNTLFSRAGFVRLLLPASM